MSDTMTPGIAVAPHAGYAALGVVLKAYTRHPRADELMAMSPNISERLNEAWYLVRWEEGERNLVHHSELRPYPLED